MKEVCQNPRSESGWQWAEQQSSVPVPSAGKPSPPLGSFLPQPRLPARAGLTPVFLSAFCTV